MKSMFIDYFVKSPVMVLPVLSLLLFVILFSGVALRVWRRGKQAYDPQARLPLDGGCDE